MSETWTPEGYFMVNYENGVFGITSVGEIESRRLRDQIIADHNAAHNSGLVEALRLLRKVTLGLTMLRDLQWLEHPDWAESSGWERLPCGCSDHPEDGFQWCNRHGPAASLDAVHEYAHAALTALEQA